VRSGATRQPPNRQGLYNRSCMRRLTVLLTALIVGTCVAACGSRPLQITAVQLGRSLNPDHSVAQFTTVFAPRDGWGRVRNDQRAVDLRRKGRE
jgi:hypothetical protein